LETVIATKASMSAPTSTRDTLLQRFVPAAGPWLKDQRIVDVDWTSADVGLTCNETPLSRSDS